MRLIPSLLPSIDVNLELQDFIRSRTRLRLMQLEVGLCLVGLGGSLVRFEAVRFGYW